MSLWLRLESSAGASWVGETLGVSNGSGSDTWDFDTRFAGIKASGQEIAADVVAWHNEAGRPWFGVETATFSEVAVALTGRAQAVITSTASTTWTVSAGLGTLMGWASGAAASVIPVTTTGTLLSVAVDLRVARFVRWDQEPGAFHNGESFIHGAAVAAHRRPEVSGVLTEQQAAQLTASLPDAVNPRQMHVFQDEDSVFRLVELGSIDRSRGRDLYSYTFEVIA